MFATLIICSSFCFYVLTTPIIVSSFSGMRSPTLLYFRQNFMRSPHLSYFRHNVYVSPHSVCQQFLCAHRTYHMFVKMFMRSPHLSCFVIILCVTTLITYSSSFLKRSPHLSYFRQKFKRSPHLSYVRQNFMCHHTFYIFVIIFNVPTTLIVCSSSCFVSPHFSYFRHRLLYALTPRIIFP